MCALLSIGTWIWRDACLPFSASPFSLPLPLSSLQHRHKDTEGFTAAFLSAPLPSLTPSHPLSPSQRRHMDMEGFTADATHLRKMLASIDRKLHEMRLIDR